LSNSYSLLTPQRGRKGRSIPDRSEVVRRARDDAGIKNKILLFCDSIIMLKGKKILLGITGSIAAYKAIYLVRLFIKAGAEVKVVMTPSSKDFVSSLTLSTLSKNPVLVDLFDGESWANHVMLGR